MRYRCNNDGFTLIEILVVVAIIGVLMSIAVINYGYNKRRANDSLAQTQLRNLALSMESYFVDNSIYTTSISSLSGYTPQTNVTVSVSSSDPSIRWSATAYHTRGTDTYTWSSTSGGIQP